MWGETSLSWLKVSLLKTIEALPLAEDFSFFPIFEEFLELH